MDPATIAFLSSMGIDILGQFLGAKGKSDADAANLAFQMQRQGMLQSYANQMMLPGTNPMATAMMGFLRMPQFSMGANFNVNGRNVTTTQGGQPVGNGVTTPGSNGSQSGGPGGGGSGDYSDINANLMAPGGYTIGGPQYNQSSGSTYGAGGMGTPAGFQYQGDPNMMGNIAYDEATQSYKRENLGKNPSVWQARDIENLVNKGTSVQDAWAKVMGNIPFDQSMFGGDWTSSAPDAGNSRWMTTQPVPNNVPQLPAGGWVDDNGIYHPPNDNPANARYLQNGQYTDANGNVTGPGPSSNPGYPGQGNQPGGIGDFAAGMYTYQDPGMGAFGYNPTQLQSAPMVGGLPQLSTAGATGTQYLNAGQDALMQMMRKNLTPQQDPGLAMNLQQLGSGNSMYDTSGLFSAIDKSAQQGLDQQIAQLHGSAGSLGERFGTSMGNREMQMREKFLADTNLQKQQIGQSSFEAAQGRRLPALDATAGLLNQNNQYGLQALGLQGGFASQLGGLGTSGAGLDLQAQQGNLNAFLQAALANQGTASQFLTNNANILNQAGQFNAGQRMAQNQFGASQGNQYNNLMMAGMAQAAGLQSNQNSYNTSLLGILGSTPTPQVQPSPWGGALSDASGALAMPYLLSQFGGGGSKNAASFSPMPTSTRNFYPNGGSSAY